jgi:FKBP-type peptidyl-prolyl cis-trans isomerase FkpA
VRSGRFLKKFLGATAVAAAVAAGAGCGTPTSPSGHAAFEQLDLRLGAGDPVVSGATLTVDYTGWLYDATKPENKGAIFDSSTGRTPLTFQLGFGQVIAGWDQGMGGMRVGGLRRLTVPPSLAYGQDRNGAIPPNSTLIFEIDLEAVAVPSS